MLNKSASLKKMCITFEKNIQIKYLPQRTKRTTLLVTASLTQFINNYNTIGLAALAIITLCGIFEENISFKAVKNPFFIILTKLTYVFYIALLALFY